MAKQPSLPHVKYVKRGETVYAYFNTGQKKDGKPIYAALPRPGSVGFFDSYGAFCAGRTKRQAIAYTVEALANEYEASEQFGKLALGTRNIYGLTLNRIRTVLVDVPANELEPSDVRDVLDGEALGPGSFNLFLSVLSSMYRWGRQRNKVTAEPTRDIDKQETGEHAPWPNDVLTAGLCAEHNRTRLVINLLFYTGQRIGDVCKMRWNDIKDGAIVVTQQKTGKTLYVPIHAELRGELDRTRKAGITIVANQLGQPMTTQVPRKELKAFAASQGHPTLKPHGLRKNAVIALLEAGCTVAETAAITGQTFNIVEQYARRVDQAKLGKAAILKLENRPGRGNRFGK